MASQPAPSTLEIRELLYAGRLAPEKNLSLLLDLLTGLKADGGDYRLLVAGDGPMREDFLLHSQRQHPDKIVHLGHIRDRERLADVMANVDAFIHPNPNEPYGIAPLESMAAGVPLIAPDSGGVTTYANSGNAWVVPARASAFAEAVRLVGHDARDRESRTMRARATAERLHWPEVCAGFLSVYRNLYARVAGGASPPPEEPSFYSTPGDWLGFEISARRPVAEGDRRLGPS